MSPEERLRTARTALTLTHPYLAPLLFSMSLVPTDQVRILAGDRHARLYYHPEALGLLEDTHLVGLLWQVAHHVLRGHYGERGEALKEKGGELADVALDLEVNDDAWQAGVHLPRPPHPLGVPFPDLLDLPPHLLAEEYLARLLERNPDPDHPSLPQGSGRPLDQHGPGPWELPPPSGDLPGLEEEVLEVVRLEVAKRALEWEAKGRGQLPAGFRRWVRQVLEPRVDWRSILRAFLRRSVADLASRHRPTYARRNRRASAYHPVILPGHYGLKPRLAVVVDTSGSMGERELAQALAEVRAILKRTRQVYVLSVDAALGSVRRVFRPEEVELLGGGGTDMRVGVEAALALRPPPDIILVLTDGDTPWPDRPPPVPLLAVLIGPSPHLPPSHIPFVRVQED